MMDIYVATNYKGSTQFFFEEKELVDFLNSNGHSSYFGEKICPFRKDKPVINLRTLQKEKVKEVYTRYKREIKPEYQNISLALFLRDVPALYTTTFIKELIYGTNT